MSRKITQKDVAQAAGISQALVSLVLSDEGKESGIRVSEATRQRILSVAEELGYISKRKQPANIRHKTLVYIRPECKTGRAGKTWIEAAEEAFCDAMQCRLIEAAYQKDFSVITRFYDSQRPGDLAQWLSQVAVEGVFLHSDDRKLGEWLVTQYPVVQLNRKAMTNADVVLPNQEEIIVSAMEHFRKKGHKNIALLTAGSSDAVRKMRLRAYEEYAGEFQLRTYEEYADCRTAEEFFGHFLKNAKERPSAILAEDFFALSIQQEAINHGLSLPEDLSIIGIDSTDITGFCAPALTSVNVRPEEIARVGVSLVMERMKNRSTAFQKIEITPRLTARQSVADRTRILSKSADLQSFIR